MSCKCTCHMVGYMRVALCMFNPSVSPFFIFTFFECLLPLICSGCDCWKETQSLSRLSSYWDFGSLVKRLQLHLVKQSSYGMCMNVTCLKVVANWYVSEINCTFVFQFFSFSVSLPLAFMNDELIPSEISILIQSNLTPQDVLNFLDTAAYYDLR